MEAPKLEYIGTWEEIAAHAPAFGDRKLHLIVVAEDQTLTTSNESVKPLERTPTARELLQMSTAERHRILETQFAEAAAIYRSVAELTDFDA